MNLLCKFFGHNMHSEADINIPEGKFSIKRVCKRCGHQEPNYKYRCRRCGGESYTGYFCLNCDKNWFRYSFRSGFAYIWLPGFIFAGLGAGMMWFSDWVFWDILWGMGFTLLLSSALFMATLSRKLMGRHFERIEEAEGRDTWDFPATRRYRNTR